MNKYIKILLATIWIVLNEFLRNQILFLNIWEKYFQSKSLKFETTPVNGIIWTIWSLLNAIIIYLLLQKYNSVKTFAIVWIFGYVMMWLTLYNLQVLPPEILFPAIPLSIFEVIGAIFIIKFGTK